MEEKKIDYRFKILYAVGMLEILCGHCFDQGIALDFAGWFPYGGLHIALFVFCSGYFFKDSSVDHTGKYILKKIRTLMVPLYLYTFAYGLIVQISHLWGFTIGGDFTWENLLIAPLNNGHQFVYNMGGWFVAPLFFCEVGNILLRKLLSFLPRKIPESVLFLLSVFLGLAGNRLACDGYNTGWWLLLVRILYFVPFFGLGIYYNRVLEKHDRKIPGILYFSIIFMTKLVLYYHYGKVLYYTPSWCNNFTEGPLMPILVGYLGIAFWLRIASIAEPVIGKNKYVNLIADNSYSIMMNHFLGFMMLKTMFAFVAKFTSHFADFDWIGYKSNIWWFYIPRNIGQIYLLYILAGLIVSILLQLLINKIKSGSKSIFRRIRNNFSTRAQE